MAVADAVVLAVSARTGANEAPNLRRNYSNQSARTEHLIYHGEQSDQSAPTKTLIYDGEYSKQSASTKHSIYVGKFANQSEKRYAQPDDLTEPPRYRRSLANSMRHQEEGASKK